MSASKSQPENQTNTDQFLDSIDQFLDECLGASRDKKDHKEFYRWIIDRLATLTSAQQVVLWVQGPEQICFAAIASKHASPNSKSASNLSTEQFEQIQSLDRAESFTNANRRMIAAPVFRAGSIPKVMTLFLANDQPDELARVYCELFDALIEIVDQFESRQLVEDQNERLSSLNQFVELLKNSQSSLESKTLGSNLTNDLRALTESDRVWLFQASGHTRFLACSSVANVDSRSQALKDVRNLVQEALRFKKSYFFTKKTIDQIPAKYRRLAKFMETFSMEGLYIVLIPKKSGKGFLGALVVECFHEHDEVKTIGILNNVAVCIENSLSNSLAWERLPFRNTLNALQSVADQFRFRYLLRTLVFLGVLAGVLFALFFIKIEFELTVSGEFQPVSTQNLFAPEKSVVSKILVKHGDEVRSGEQLIQLASPDLELKIEKLEGEIKSKTQIIQTDEIRLTQATRLKDAVVAAQISAAIEQNKLEIGLLQSERDFYLSRKNDLVILSPQDGVIVSRDLRKNLMNRPVELGNRLITVADKKGPWEIILHIPDIEMGYINQAIQDNDVEQINVAYKLASDLEQQYSCEVQNFDNNISVDRSGQSIIRAFAPLDKSQFEELKIGQTIHARVQCGKRSVFFIWTRGIRDFLKSRFFWTN